MYEFLSFSLSIYLTSYCDYPCIVRNHPLTGSKSFRSFIEKANFPFSKSLAATQPRREWIYPPPPFTSFQVISCIKDELDPSSIYRGQDIGYSSVEKVDALLGHPCRRLYTTLPQFPVSFYVSGLLPPSRRRERKREKFDGIGSCLKQHAWPRQREGEKPMRLVLFGNLLVSHCEEFTWPGSRFVELCNRLDSTRFFFSGRR